MVWGYEHINKIALTLSSSTGCNRWQLDSKTEKVTSLSTGQSILINKWANTKHRLIPIKGNNLNIFTSTDTLYYIYLRLPLQYRPGIHNYSALQFRRRHFRQGPFQCQTISLLNNFGPVPPNFGASATRRKWWRWKILFPRLGLPNRMLPHTY